MSLSSTEFTAPAAPAAALAATPRFRLRDFVMAPFRDIDGRVDRDQGAREALKAREKKRRERD